MMNNSLEVSEDGKISLAAIASNESDNFSSLVVVAGLSKRTDFVGADLSYVDFSGSDLRGFNFTNADLSNTYGINFLADETTILDGAIVTSSVLQLEKERREFFAMNRDHVALFNRLKNEYWTNGAIWVAENLKPTSKNYETSSKIAKYLYSSVKDQTYKNQILYGIKHSFRETDEYKAFLTDQLRDGSITYRTLRGVLDILGRTFGGDPDVTKVLLLYLGHENKEVRKISLEPVMRRAFFRKNRLLIIDHMNDEKDPEIRRLYTRYFARMFGESAVRLLFRHDTRAFHDYADRIDDRLFENLVRGYVRLAKIDKKSTEQFKFNASHETLVSHKDFLDNIESCDGLFAILEKAGLPLNTTYNVDRFYPKYNDDRTALLANDYVGEYD